MLRCGTLKVRVIEGFQFHSSTKIAEWQLDPLDAADTMKKPGFSFIEYLIQLRDSAHNKPLNAAIKRAAIMPQRYELLTIEVIQRPQIWLGNASLGDVEALLCEAVKCLSIQSFSRLLYTIGAKFQLQKSNLKGICRHLSDSGRWDHAVGILDALDKAEITLPRDSLNHLLNQASKEKDSQYFLAIFEFFRRMKVSPNITTLGIIIYWNSTRPTLAVGFGELGVSNSSKADYDGSLRSGSIHKTSIEPSSQSKLIANNGTVGNEILSCVPYQNAANGPLCHSNGIEINSATDFDNLWKSTRQKDHSNELVKIFCSGKALLYQNVLLESFVTTSMSPLVDETIRSLVFEKRYNRAHYYILDSLLNESLKTDRVSLSIDIFRYLLTTGIGIPNPSTVDIVLNAAFNQQNLADALNLLQGCLEVAPQAISSDRLNWTCRYIYDHGYQSLATNLLAKVNEQQDHFNPSTIIYGNMLLLDDPFEFIRDSLPQLARKSSESLLAALTSLIRRNRFVTANRLFRSVLKSNPEHIGLLHYSVTLQATTLSGDRQGVIWIFGEIKSKFNDQFTRIIYTSRGKSYDLIDSTLEIQTLGLAIAMTSLPNINKFTSYFFRIFDGAVAPNLETIRMFLMVQNDFSHRKDGTTEWSVGFINWMERREVSPNLSIYAKLAYLAARTCDTDLALVVAQQLVSKGLRPNISVYKELFKCAITFSTASSLVISAETLGIKFDANYYESIIKLAIDEDKLDKACQWTTKAINIQVRISKDLVRRLVSTLFETVPLSTFLPFLEQMHGEGYYASPEIYVQFLRHSISSKNFLSAHHYYELLLRIGHVVSTDDCLKLLELVIMKGEIQRAYFLWKRMATMKNLPIDMIEFNDILDRFMTPSTLCTLSPLRSLRLESAQYVYELAIRKNLMLPSLWCQSVLENGLALGDFDLCRRIHLYITTTRIEIGPTICLRVSALWRRQMSKDTR